jgi:enterobactin synthetase component D
MRIEDFENALMGLPFVEALRLGPLPVALLPSAARVEPALIDQLLTSEEAAFAAETLRHERRRDEYRRSRYLIRRISGFRGALPKFDEGDPSWPPGTLGSLTHKDGTVAVTMVPAGFCAGVGLDAEVVAKVRPEFEARLTCRGEPALLTERANALGVPRSQLLALLFSFKEALFKSHFPSGRRMFYFHDAEVLDISAQGAIRAKVLVDTGERTRAGHETGGFYLWKGDLVLTAAILPS